MKIRLLLPLFAFAAFAAQPIAAEDASPPLIRVGIVGLDTSHVPAFTKLFNNPNAEGDLAGFKVVAGYPGGTDMPASKDRVERFTEQIRGMGVEIVETIPQLLERVDAVLLESVDGRIHLEEAKQIFPSGKPVFIDKPLGGNLPESIAIFELAKQYKVPVFSSSSTRFGDVISSLGENKELGDIVGAATWGPCSYQSGTPDLFFYGIHGVEALYTIMGSGCETVSRIKSPTHDQVTGTWAGGRLGVYRGIVKGKAKFGMAVYGTNDVFLNTDKADYGNLCKAIGKFFRTGIAPVSQEETLELLTFLEAADESVRQDGKAIPLTEVFAKAKEEAKALIK